jgi:hypothetical protein
MGRPGYLTLPILSVLAAIGYVYYTTVFVAVARWLGLATAAGAANAAAFTALAAACVATYAVAVCRDPGRVPPSFTPDVEDAESPLHEIKRKVRSRCPIGRLSAYYRIWISGVEGLLGYGHCLTQELHWDISALYIFAFLLRNAANSQICNLVREI